MTVITKDNIKDATPWEPNKESTLATQTLDISKLKHAFAAAAAGN